MKYAQRLYDIPQRSLTSGPHPLGVFVIPDSFDRSIAERGDNAFKIGPIDFNTYSI